jgi:hypothetical protein
MALPEDGDVIVNVDGEDEAAAAAAMNDLLRRLTSL